MFDLHYIFSGGFDGIFVRSIESYVGLYNRTCLVGLVVSLCVALNPMLIYTIEFEEKESCQWGR